MSLFPVIVVFGLSFPPIFFELLLSLAIFWLVWVYYTESPWTTLFVGFHFQLETPRWAVLTAAIVAAGPAFAAGGEPYSGAIRYRGFLRIIGTFIGCIAGLVIIIAMIRAPLLMILVCCIWAGFCTWISSLVRIENSYAWGLAGYTALIIVITIQPEPLLTPQFAVERCSEIVIGIVCAIMAANKKWIESWKVCWSRNIN